MTVLQLMAVLSKLPKDKKVIIHAYDAFDGIVAHVEDVSVERADDYLSDFQQSVLCIDDDVVVIGGYELTESEEQKIWIRKN